MIQTSNYSRKGNDLKSISISYSIIPQIRMNCPDLRHMPELGPNWFLLSKWKDGLITEEQYTYEYLDILAKRVLSPDAVLEMLPKDCYLLCYEAPHDFCHRHVLAEYIERGTGVVIREWLTEEETKKFEKAAKQEEYVESVLEF